MTWNAAPRDGEFVLVVLGRELLHEAVDECSRLPGIRATSCNLFSWEDVEKKGEVCRVRVRSRTEVPRRTHGNTELGIEMAVGRSRERVSLARSRSTLRREESR